jgi:hypothetical protein
MPIIIYLKDKVAGFTGVVPMHGQGGQFTLVKG